MEKDLKNVNPNYDPLNIGLDDSVLQDDAILGPTDSDLYRLWKMRTQGNVKNDFLIAISPASQTSGSGSGKTTLAVTLAQMFDQTEEGFDAETKATMDSGELAYDIIPDLEPGSAVVYDEAQGAVGTQSVNARRGQTNEALDAITAILTARDSNATWIVVAQQLGMLDKLLLRMLDAWLLIVRDPAQPDGPVAVHHQITMNDYEPRSTKLKTPAVEELVWDDLPPEDPDYLEMERKKQEAKRQTNGSDAEDAPKPTEMPKELRDRAIRRLADQGVEQKAIAETFELTQTSVSRIAAGKQ